MATKSASVPFGEWLPDQPTFRNPGTPYVNNVIPGFTAYEPLKGKQLITTDTTNITSGQEAIDAYSITSPAGQAIMAVFRDESTGLSELFVLKGTVWTKITTLLNESNTNQVTFAKWQDRTVMFSSGSGFTPSYFNPLSDTAATVMAAGNSYPVTKADRLAAGSPPEFRYIASVGQFVVLANRPDAEDLVKWSQIGDIDTWTLVINSAGEQTIRGGQGVTGLIGGENGLVFTEETIHYMQFIGGDSVFQFQRVQDSVGAVSQQSIAKAGDRVFFLDRRGFFQTNTFGRNLQAIGEGKINRWFFDNATLTFPERMSTAVDPTRPIVYWSFVSNASTNTSHLPDKILAYNWQANRWSQGDLECNTIFSAFTLGTVMADLTGNMDDTPSLPMNDPSFAGGCARFGVIDRDNKLNYMTGDTLEAQIDTKTDQISDTQRVRIDTLTPIVDTAKCQVRANLQDRLGGPVESGDFEPVDDDGIVVVDDDAKYFSARIKIPAATTWTQAQGVEINLGQGGKTN